MDKPEARRPRWPVLRSTRAAAWWAAKWVRRHYDPLGHLGGRKYQKAYDRMHRRQDRVAAAIGSAVLKAPRIP